MHTTYLLGKTHFKQKVPEGEVMGIMLMAIKHHSKSFTENPVTSFELYGYIRRGYTVVPCGFYIWWKMRFVSSGLKLFMGDDLNREIIHRGPPPEIIPDTGGHSQKL